MQPIATEEPLAKIADGASRLNWRVHDMSLRSFSAVGPRILSAMSDHAGRVAVVGTGRACTARIRYAIWAECWAGPG